MLFSFAIANSEINYNEWTIKLGSKNETGYLSNIWGKIQFVNYNGLARNIFGQQEMYGVVKLDNGYLLTTYDYESDEVLLSKAEALCGLNSYLQEQSIPMLFAITPYTSSKYDPQLPIGVYDYGNQNIDRFMAFLDEYNIETIDFREEMYRDGINQYDMMYKTDHHWTTMAGFYGYTKILGWMQETMEFEVDSRVTDLDNYSVETYKRWHLGSRGQRTGKYYAGIDDFDLIIPNFETEICLGDIIGTFEEVIINKKPLQNREYTSRYTYDFVLENSLGKHINNKSLNDKKILLIADSMGRAVNPYLILSVKEIRYIYAASSSNLTREYINEYDSDVVILLYYPDFIQGGNGGFDFCVE